MSYYVIHCPKCTRAMRVRPEQTGSAVACPTCGAHVRPTPGGTKPGPSAAPPVHVPVFSAGTPPPTRRGAMGKRQRAFPWGRIAAIAGVAGAVVALVVGGWFVYRHLNSGDRADKGPPAPRVTAPEEPDVGLLNAVRYIVPERADYVLCVDLRPFRSSPSFNKEARLLDDAAEKLLSDLALEPVKPRLQTIWLTGSYDGRWLLALAFEKAVAVKRPPEARFMKDTTGGQTCWQDRFEFDHENSPNRWATTAAGQLLYGPAEEVRAVLKRENERSPVDLTPLQEAAKATPAGVPVWFTLSRVPAKVTVAPTLPDLSSEITGGAAGVLTFTDQGDVTISARYFFRDAAGANSGKEKLDKAVEEQRKEPLFSSVKNSEIKQDKDREKQLNQIIEIDRPKLTEQLRPWIERVSQVHDEVLARIGARYAQVVRDADQALRDDKYGDAQDRYTNAKCFHAVPSTHTLTPTETDLQARIEAVKQVNGHTQNGIKAFYEKRYDDALTAFKEAVAVFEKSLKQYGTGILPKDWHRKALYYRGEAYLSGRKYSEAEKDFTEARDLYRSALPPFPEAEKKRREASYQHHLSLGKSSRKDRKYDDAAKEFLRARDEFMDSKDSPEYGEAEKERLTTLDWKKRYESYKDYLKDATDKLAKKQYAAALKSFTRARDEVPHDQGLQDVARKEMMDAKRGYYDELWANADMRRKQAEDAFQKGEMSLKGSTDIAFIAAYEEFKSSVGHCDDAVKGFSEAAGVFEGDEEQGKQAAARQASKDSESLRTVAKGKESLARGQHARRKGEMAKTEARSLAKFADQAMQYKEAEGRFQQAEDHFRDAENHFADSDLKKEANKLRTNIQGLKRSAQYSLHFAQGRDAFSKGLDELTDAYFDEAIKSFEEALRAKPEDNEASQEKARAQRVKDKDVLAEEVLQWNNKPLKATCAAFAPNKDSTLSVVGCEDGSVLVWDWRKRKIVRLFAGAHKTKIVALAISPDGTKAIAMDSATLTVSDLNQLDRDPVRFGSGGTALAFHPDGKRVLVGRETGIVELWKLTEGRPRVVHEEALDYAIRALAVADRDVVATAGHTAYFCYIKDDKFEWGAMGKGWPVGDKPGAIVLQGGDAVIANGNELQRWRTSTRERKLGQEIKLPGPVRCLALAPDGNFLCGSDKVVHLGGVSRKLDGPEGAIGSVSVSPDGRRAAAVSSPDGTLFLWRLRK